MPENQPRRRIGRRGLLRGVGASALATSAVVFGTSQPALADKYACCYLVHPPSSYSSCQNANYKYIWYCQFTRTTGCACCEKKNSSGTITASAYFCERV